MKTFSIDKLRSDTAYYFTTYQYCSHSLTSEQFDEVINFMIEALIGDTAYKFLALRKSRWSIHFEYVFRRGDITSQPYEVLVDVGNGEVKLL